MYDIMIYAPGDSEILKSRSSRATEAEFGNVCWNKIKKDFIGQLTAGMLTTADKAKESFFDGTSTPPLPSWPT